jgi:hypothetical protein
MTEETIETGLLGATVNPAPAPAPLPVPTPPPPPPPANMPVGWTMQKVAAFIRDLAHNMYEVPFVLKTHNVSQAQYDSVKDSEFFQNMLRAMTIEWNSIDNTQKRLAIEAAIALEDAMPILAARMHKPTELLTGVVELAKLFAKVAGVGEAASHSTAPTEKFKIVINLGSDTQQFDKSHPTIVVGHDDAPPTNSMAVQTLP